MKKTFVVGDIHGGFKALMQVLKMSSLTEKDRLIFLGDFVDGWSESFEVVDFLIGLSRNQECIFIKGNHDDWCEQWLESELTNDDWVTSGGQATIDSYQNRTLIEKARHLAFYQSLRSYYTDEENRLFIHAGFASVRGPKNERYPSNYFWDRSLWEMALCLDDRLKPGDHRYPKRLKLFKEIYIGHTPTLHIGASEPVNGGNVWNIDTGAAFHGKLSMMEVGTKQVWQSDTVKDLYPGEDGRKK